MDSKRPWGASRTELRREVDAAAAGELATLILIVGVLVLWAAPVVSAWFQS